MVRHGVLEEGIAFLSKPFDLGELARTVRGVLDKAPVPVAFPEVPDRW